MVCPRQTRPALAWQPDLPGLAYALGPRILIVANPFGLIFFVLNKYCLITFWLSFEKKSSMSFLLIFNGVHGLKLLKRIAFCMDITKAVD